MSVRLHTYTEFFKAFVTRKKQDLVSPRFWNVSDITLPRGSVIHYMPKHEQDDGPAYPESFISNYPNEVYIDFQFGFTPYIGHGHNIAFVPGPVIKFYRNKHYEYKWVKDTAFAYRNDKRLVVQNHALAPRNWVYSANMFINFSKSYNNWSMLINRVNETGHNYKDRQQFVRIDLPINMPGFKELLTNTLRYKASFKDNLPVIDNSVIRATKAENCYWLMDMILFLQGDKEHNIFAKLDKDVLGNLHFLICSNSKVWVINVGLFLSWIEPLQAKQERVLIAIKRFYLNLIHLVNGSVQDTALEQSNEKQSRRELVEGEETPEDHRLGEDPTRSEATGESQASSDAAEETALDHVDIVDLFKQSKKASTGTSGTDGTAGSTDDAGSTTTVSSGDGAAEGTSRSSRDADQSGGTIELDWLSPIDDHYLEPAVVAETISTVKDVFDKPESGINLVLDEMAKEGTLTVKQKQYYESKAKSYKEIGMPNGQSLEEFIKIPPEELTKIDGKVKGTFNTVKDETLLRQRVVSLRNDYPKKFLHKDIAAAVLNLQNAGIILADYQVEQVQDIEGSYDVIKMQLMPVKGKSVVRSFPIPTVDEDGNFTVDGVKSYFQFQRTEKPIRKINERRVVLTSLYDKKVNITRSEMVVDDYGKWLIKQIVLGNANGKLTTSNASLIDRSVKCPRYVTLLNRKFRSIKVNTDPFDLTFNFDTHALLEQHPEWKIYCKETIWPIGEYKKKVLTIDNYGIVSLAGTVMGSLEELLGIMMNKSPIEYAVVNVNGYLFPVGVMLCYYFGIDKLLKVLKPTYRSIPAGQRYKLLEDEFSLVFNDEQLIFSKREQIAALIFGGMVKLNNLSNCSRSDLNGTGIWVPLMGDPRVKPTHFKEMRNMFDLFIDPITKERLQVMGYSTSFHYLVIDAVKLLMTDYTRHEVELEEQNVIGYERFVHHIYSELCKSNRQFKNKTETGNQTFDLNPIGIITNIITDSSKGDVKEMNPFQEMKAQEDITFGGFKGRDADTMMKHTRGQLTSYKGVISEANKDNGKVGFVAYLTSDPRIKDFRGNVNTKEESKGYQMFSAISAIKYGATLDSPQRTSYASVQASHAISCRNYTANIIRTGGESVAAHRLGDTHAKVAKQDGRVIKVTAEGIVVQYKDGTTDSCQLGLRLGKSDGRSYRHTLITDLTEGSTFKEGSLIAWNTEWFDKDIYNPSQVIVKMGRMTRAFLVEDQTVFEDSMEFWSGLAEEFKTPVPKENSFLFNADETIKLRRKIGDNVEFDSILCEVLDSYVDNFESEDDIINEINRSGIRQIKSQYAGKVIHIELVYNAIEEEMSESVKKLIREYDKKRSDLSKLLGKGLTTNRIGTGINVKKTSIPYGTVKLSIYVESMVASTVSDKYVYGNQMKGTVGYIVPHQMYTEDGRPVPLKFSFKSMFKRMVISLRNKGVVNEFSYGVKDKFIALYRGNT